MTNNKTESKLRVGVIVGGSPEELNDSISTAHEVAKALEKTGKHVEIITFDDRFETSVSYARIDVAFIIDATYLGRFKKGVNLRKTLEKLQIPYTGSKLKASSITKNKSLSKGYFRKANLLTPNYVNINRGNLKQLKQLISKQNIKPPFVVKPRDEGAGMGVVYCKTFDDLRKAARNLLFRYHDLIVEVFIKETEVTVPILEINKHPLALAVIEIQKSGGIKVLSYDIKSEIQLGPLSEGKKKVKFVIPANLEKSLYDQALKDAARAHIAIGCRAYSRVDMVIDKDNRIFILEINSLPVIAEFSNFTKAAKLNKITYEGIVDNILKSAFK